MRLNYSRSPELYLNFLRTNFSELPGVDAVPVSSTASPDTLAGLFEHQPTARVLLPCAVHPAGIFRS